MGATKIWWRQLPKIRRSFSLTGGDNSAQLLCAQLCEHGLGKVQVYVGENLSYPEEKITSGTAEEIGALQFPSLSVMMILNEEAQPFTPHCTWSRR